MEIHYIYNRITHHSYHSGYDQIVKHIKSNRVEDNVLHSILNILPERFLAHLRKTAGPWYNSQALKKELQIIPNYIIRSNRIYHFLYGEDSYHYSGYFNLRKSNKNVVTFHHPSKKFDCIMPNKKHLKKIDALVVICSQQANYFSNLVEGNKIHQVPHGIDTEFFHPVKIEKKIEQKNCLFVGTHLRDFKTLKKVIEKVNCMKNKIHFTIVTDKQHFNELSGLENTHLLEKIREVELLNLYRESDVLLLPITDCTANNTLLEAMACGLPIITNNVGGVRDYANNKCAVFIEQGDADLMVAQLIKLFNNDVLRKEMSSEARQRAMQFDWKIIASRIKEIYKALFI